MTLYLRTALALLLAEAVLHTGTARAADSYKAGDEIEVSYLDSWLPATVVKINQRGDVLAEFEWVKQPQQRVFKPADVRYPYEAGALARAREWSDLSGKFHRKAALIEIGDESVTLRKPDKSEIKVAISTLSDPDQQFLKRLQKEAGIVRPPQPPPLEDFEGAAAPFASIATFGGETNRAALEPDPLPAYLKLKQGGVGFPKEDFFDHLGAVLTVGGKDVWLLTAVVNEAPGGPKLPTRLLWASLARQKIEGRQLLPPGEIVLDYHGPSRRVLTYSRNKQDKSNGNQGDTAALTLWEVTPTDKKVKPLVRWKGDSEVGSVREPWARIIDADVVVQCGKQQELVGWDTSAKRVRYRTAEVSFISPSPALSGGRKYLFVPEDKGVRILDSRTGRVVSMLLVKGGASAVGISEDGRKAAVSSPSGLTVWDLTNQAAEPQHYQAEGIGTDLFWVGDDRVIAHRSPGMVLFSLKHRVSLWSYLFIHHEASESAAHRDHEIVDQHLVYGASLSEGWESGLAVGALLLPGPQVEEAAAALDPESLFAIKAGTAVRLDVQAGNDAPRVQAAMEARIKANGWTLSPTATTVLVAEMKRGEQQKVDYRFGGFGKPQTSQSATVIPYVSTARLMIGDQVAWQSATSSSAPWSVTLKEGESVQGEVDRWQRPNVEFFDTLDIPARIMDPAKRKGLGVTMVTNRGFVVAPKK